MITISILISFGIISTFLVNYKLYNDCIKEAKYDDIPELNDIIKKELEEEKINNKKFKKIIDNCDDKEYEDFIIIKNEFELANKE
tara:strand:+ start:8542 stop:8796 length:255 start_codon:yes stop_codon:yes gene_type:complete